MSYSEIDKPDLYFNTKLYSGDSTSSHAITGVNFTPDLVWLKARNVAEQHHLFDVVRGASNNLNSDDTSVESSSIPLSSFDSDGFTLGSANSAINGSSYTYASWNWKANGAGVSNTAGTISSTVSANTTSGFSIVSYTGNGSAGSTIGHGLGVKPSMIIVKGRNFSDNWVVYHQSLATTEYLILNLTNAKLTDNEVVFYDTQPTSSVFTVGANGVINGNTNTYIAYCFAEKKGFSKFGSYTGNGSADGTFVYTGFKPAFVILKGTNDTNWRMVDNKRLGYNPDNNALYPNGSDAEDTQDLIQFFSNGFKLTTTTTQLNGSGTSYIYMAFASQPFVTSTSIPTTAR